MLNREENFFCKEGYVANKEARTLDFSESDVYWTQERIEASISRQYQYYVYRLASKIAVQRKFSSVMDLGSGPGLKSKKIFGNILRDISLVDQPSTEKIAKTILPDANFVGVNLEDCKVDFDQEFDLIVCADVLEHLYNPMPCIEFALNRLAPAGVAIFSTPERDILRGPSCMSSPHPSHVREWNAKEFNDLLTFSGFVVMQQMYMPMEKLTSFDCLLRAFLSRIFCLSKWSACQVAICAKPLTFT